MVCKDTNNHPNYQIISPFSLRLGDRWSWGFQFHDCIAIIYSASNKENNRKYSTCHCCLWTTFFGGKDNYFSSIIQICVTHFCLIDVFASVCEENKSHRCSTYGFIHWMVAELDAIAPICNSHPGAKIGTFSEISKSFSLYLAFWSKKKSCWLFSFNSSFTILYPS